MKRKVVVCLLWLWLAGFLAVCPNKTESSHGSESLLIALENAWNQAQLHHDSKALGELAANPSISTDNDGTFMTTDRFLADNRDHSYKPSLMTTKDERVFVYE